MSPLSRLVVHIGMAQAGSTTLQNCIFNQTQFGFALLSSDRIATIHKYMAAAVAGEFEPAKCAEFFARQFEEYQNNKLIPVISMEGLSGHFLQMENNLQAEVYAHRLHEAFGKCKIVLIVREQASHIVSKYRKYLETAHGNAPLRSFIRDRRILKRMQTDCDSIYLPTLKHDKLVSLYWKLFRPENTLVLPLEMMRMQPAEFVMRLNTFCGSHVPSNLELPRMNEHGTSGLSSFYRIYNTVYSSNSTSILWFLNRRERWGRQWKRQRSPFERTFNQFRKRLVGLLKRVRMISDVKLTQEKHEQISAIRSMLGHYFVDSNQNLSKMIGIDLAEFGYNVGEWRTSAIHSEQRYSVDTAPIIRPATSQD